MAGSHGCCGCWMVAEARPAASRPEAPRCSAPHRAEYTPARTQSPHSDRGMTYSRQHTHTHIRSQRRRPAPLPLLLPLMGQLTVLLVVVVLLATGKVLPLSTCSCDDDSGEEAEGALEMRCRRSPVDFSVAAAEEPDTDTAIMIM